MSGMLEVLDGGVGWEESIVPHEEDEVHEGPKLDCSAVAGALGVFTQSEAEKPRVTLDGFWDWRRRMLRR